MEVLVVHEGWRPARLRDVELPRQVGRPPERLLVEEVAPPADRLREQEGRRHDVQIGEKRQPLGPDVGTAREQPRDEAPVDRQATLPDREHPPPRLRLVVVEVEEDVVEPGADQAADQGDLRRLEKVVGGLAAASGLAGREPEPECHRRRDEHAVPPDRHGQSAHQREVGRKAKREGNGSGRPEHGFLLPHGAPGCQTKSRRARRNRSQNRKFV